MSGTYQRYSQHFPTLGQASLISCLVVQLPIWKSIWIIISFVKRATLLKQPTRNCSLNAHTPSHIRDAISVRVPDLSWNFGEVNKNAVNPRVQAQHRDALCMEGCFVSNDSWLVVLTILKNMSQWVSDDIPCTKWKIWKIWRIKIHLWNNQPDSRCHPQIETSNPTPRGFAFCGLTGSLRSLPSQADHYWNPKMCFF